MNAKEMARWKEYRQGGKRRYVWRYGVLYWGIPVGFTSELMFRIRLKGGIHLFTGDHLYVSLVARCVIFGLVGIAFGHYMWKSMEKRSLTYRR